MIKYAMFAFAIALHILCSTICLRFTVQGESPLFNACKNGHLKTVKYLFPICPHTSNRKVGCYMIVIILIIPMTREYIFITPRAPASWVLPAARGIIWSHISWPKRAFHVLLLIITWATWGFLFFVWEGVRTTLPCLFQQFLNRLFRFVQKINASPYISSLLVSLPHPIELLSHLLCSLERTLESGRASHLPWCLPSYWEGQWYSEGGHAW